MVVKKIKLYWAKASTALTWPEPWTGTVTQPVQLGNFIGSKSPSFYTNDGTFIISFEWTPPNPNVYKQYYNDYSHFCLLARIETSDKAPYGMTYSETKSLYDNVRNNNNIAWKNISIVEPPVVVNPPKGCVIVKGVDNIGITRLQFRVPEFESVDNIFDHSLVSVQLEPYLINQWVRNGRQGAGIQLLTNNTLQLMHRDAWIGGFKLNNNDIYNICVQVLPSLVNPPTKTNYSLQVVQVNNNRIIGGETFVFPFINLAANKEVNDSLNSKDKLFNIYPNPAASDITIVNNSSADLYVYNTLGALIYSYKLQQENTTINTKNWLAGIYYFRYISSAGKKEYQKVIISH